MTTEKIVEREAGEERALNALKFPNILAVLGVRRCGKSVFSWLLLRNKICPPLEMASQSHIIIGSCNSCEIFILYVYRSLITKYCHKTIPSFLSLNTYFSGEIPLLSAFGAPL